MHIYLWTHQRQHVYFPPPLPLSFCISLVPSFSLYLTAATLPHAFTLQEDELSTMISALKQVKSFALATLHTPRKTQVTYAWTRTLYTQYRFCLRASH